jgi:hypothetical protein
VEAEPRYDLTTARVLTTRLILALIDRAPHAQIVGLLKTHLAIQPLPDFADVDRRWQMDSVLAAIAPRLDPEGHGLLDALARVLNHRRTVESLVEMPMWRDAPAEPLAAVS